MSVECYRAGIGVAVKVERAAVLSSGRQPVGQQWITCLCRLCGMALLPFRTTNLVQTMRRTK